MKKFIWHSLVLSLLFIPMNVLSRIDYVRAWNDGEPKYVMRIFLILLVWTLCYAMHMILDINETRK